MVIRAPDEFQGLYGAYETGTVSWSGLLGEDRTTQEGDACRPHQSICSILCGEGSDGVDLEVGTSHFGRITKLLVPEGATVTPGTPLVEYEERPPTTDEYSEQWERG